MRGLAGGGGDGHRVDRADLHIAFATVAGVIERGLLGEPGGQPVFGAAADLFDGLVASFRLK
ncbi:MAG TPA: hypothetical protein VHX38_01575 [Pseudonocardiaceae bacterium]|nr:hypothetical protein [Pseudonocardiaceae bacterium]